MYKLDEGRQDADREIRRWLEALETPSIYYGSLVCQTFHTVSEFVTKENGNLELHAWKY